MIEGRPGNRKWKDEEEAEAAIRSLTKLKVKEFTKSTLQSPTQIEALIGKQATQELLGDHITRPDGKQTMAPDDHPSPAIVTDPMEGIDDLGDHEE